MSSVNKVILVGNVGADPEIKSFANGGQIANLRIATSESWKDKATGEKKERTEWHSITIRNEGLIGVVERYVKKGSKLYIEGQLQTRKWQDSAGNDRYTTEVVLAPYNGQLVLLGDGGKGSQSGGGAAGGNRGASSTQSWSGPQGDLDDDIPF